MSFICHIHNYTEWNEEWNVLSAFNPFKCTHLKQWAADYAAPGEQSWTSCWSRDSNPQPPSPALYPLGHDCPILYDTWQEGFDQSIIKHTKSACLAIIESKSIVYRNWKLLQALDDDLKLVLSKNVNNYIHFQCSLMLIAPLFIPDVF